MQQSSPPKAVWGSLPVRPWLRLSMPLRGQGACRHTVSSNWRGAARLRSEGMQAMRGRSLARRPSRRLALRLRQTVDQALLLASELPKQLQQAAARQRFRTAAC